jgi:hypothetical protein
MQGCNYYCQNDSFAIESECTMWAGHIATGPTQLHKRRTKQRDSYHDDLKDGATSCPVCHRIDVLRRIRNVSTVINRTSGRCDRGSRVLRKLYCQGTAVFGWCLFLGSCVSTALLHVTYLPVLYYYLLKNWKVR